MKTLPKTPQKPSEENSKAPETEENAAAKTKPSEIGGPKGPEPTRYGDWEIGGRCTDF